jgi:glycosyltransferase involved in cell wall biosynthesis
VVLSFHDFYFSCPTVHLIDDNGKHCGGVCTPGEGRQCTILAPRLKNLPVLKHAWVHTWRGHVREMFGHVDAFVTTSNAAKEVYLRSLPVLEERRFEVIEHGRDLKQAHTASPPEDGPIRLLIPGNVDVHKGARFIRGLKEVDEEGRIELHFLGNVEGSYRDLGVFHGVYERGEFNERVREISPSFIGIFSIWPETYCHTLTEAWAAGVPVLASDIGVLRERVNRHGGGWLLDYEDPQGSYRRILEIAADREEYERELAKADLHGIRSTKEMSDDYAALYESLARGRRRFQMPSKASGSK